MKNEHSIWSIIMFGSIAVLILDTVGELLWKMTGFAEEWMAMPSFLIIAAVGFVAGWRHSIGAAAYAGLAVTLVDMTLGSWLSDLIDPEEDLLIEGIEDYIAMVLLVKLLFAIVALLAMGGWAAARRMRARREALVVADRRRLAG